MSFGFGDDGGVVMPPPVDEEAETADVRVALDVIDRPMCVSDFCVCVRNRFGVKMCVITDISACNEYVTTQPVTRKSANVWVKTRGASDSVCTDHI